MTHVEERIIMEQVKAIHDPNGGIDVDANCLLNFVDHIFNFSTVCQYIYILYLCIKIFKKFCPGQIKYIDFVTFAYMDL